MTTKIFLSFYILEQINFSAGRTTFVNEIGTKRRSGYHCFIQTIIKTYEMCDLLKFIEKHSL